MKNPWLKKQQQMYFSPPLDYGDQSLDFFSAKAKIIDYLRNKYNLDDGALEGAFVQDIVDNWAYAADLLSQRAGR